MRNNLIPTTITDKNGKTTVVYKKQEPTSSSIKTLPSPPALTGEYQPRPALKGKVLKEAKEILRLAQNGDQEYEDHITAAFLDNDIRYMRIYSGLVNNGEFFISSELADGIVETRRMLGLGEEESEQDFIDKCMLHAEMTISTGPVLEEDFDLKEANAESRKIIRWLESNWEDLDEIREFFNDRDMEDYSAEGFSSLWDDYKGFAHKPLRDGFL